MGAGWRCRLKLAAGNDAGCAWAYWRRAAGTTPVFPSRSPEERNFLFLGDERQTFRMCSLPAAHYRKPIMGLVVGKNQKDPFYCLKSKALGGEAGIRTLDTVTRMPHFECGAFDHSATSPRSVVEPASTVPVEEARG